MLKHIVTIDGRTPCGHQLWVDCCGEKRHIHKHMHMHTCACYTLRLLPQFWPTKGSSLSIRSSSISLVTPMSAEPAQSQSK